jgi:HAD superfamily hydrolase (TIGR01662 family)
MISKDVFKKIELVIFDYDGVIYDMIQPLRETVISSTEKYKLQSNGLNEDMREIFHVLEFALSRSVSDQILDSKEMLDIKLLEGIPLLKRLKIATSIYGEFREKTETPILFNGVPEIIKALTKKGKKLAILSNSAKYLIEQTLDHFKLKKYFEIILGAADVTKVKPDPEGLLKICAELSVKPKNTLFIGDMISDIQAGENAGIHTIAVASGIIEEEKLSAQNPFTLVHDILELHEFFNL